MLINGQPINGVVLGGGVAPFVPADPVTVVPRQSIVWDVRVMLDGVDVSHLLTGTVMVDLERDAAAVAEFTLLLDPGPVNPLANLGKPVAVYYRDWAAGSWSEVLLFEGSVIRPDFDPVNRMVRCDCSDRLQDLLEAMTVEEIDALVGGLWSADLFEAPAGRPRWDYAQERKSSRPYTLQKRPGGAIEMLPLETSAPAFYMGSGVTMDQSLVWQPVELSQRLNVVELVAEYRYANLRQRHQRYVWEHPDVEGLAPQDGFCFLYGLGGSEVPDIEMITEETLSAGFQTILQGADWRRVPLSGAGASCDPPFIWSNVYPDLLLAADWSGAVRWAQPVVERYTIRIEAPASVATAGEVLQRDQIAADSSELDRVAEFEAAEYTAPDPDAVEDALGDWVVAVREADRWAEALQCALSVNRTAILLAHRGNRLSYQMPTTDVMGLRLEHTAKVEDQYARCQAPVWSLIHELDIDSQTALTTITLAVSQGGGTVTDPLVMPSALPNTPDGSPNPAITLPSYIYTGFGEEIDETQPGFYGNYSSVITPMVQRRLVLPAPEIPAEHRDEFVTETAVTYRVAIPNDLMEFV